MDKEKAFPGDTGHGFERGMDLRDYFAAKAMQSFLMNVTSIPDSQINEFIEKLPKSCYAIADKMLKERNK